MFGKYFVFCLFFVTSASLTAQKKQAIDSEFGWTVQSLQMINEKKVSSVKREVSEILEFVTEAKKAARLFDGKLFLMNDAEIDCHGRVVRQGEEAPGLVEVKQQSNGDLTIYGFSSVTKSKPAVTLHLNHNSTDGQTTIEWFEQNKKVVAGISFGGKSTIKITENGEMICSVSWNADGSGKWMKLSKAGKYSGGEMSAVNQVALSAK